MMLRLVTNENRKWWTLAAVGFGLFMIMLDNKVVNVALPSIPHGLSVALLVAAGIAVAGAVAAVTLVRSDAETSRPAPSRARESLAAAHEGAAR